jgi:hypothetical protein
MYGRPARRIKLCRHTCRRVVLKYLRPEVNEDALSGAIRYHPAWESDGERTPTANGFGGLRIFDLLKRSCLFVPRSPTSFQPGYVTSLGIRFLLR